jgi:type II secretory pathway pseudopilin PulG
MIVVALIGILAAVVIPNWTSTSRNKKYDPEISAMMTEISTREAQYKTEVGNGLYLAAPTCPATPVPAGADFNTGCVTTGSVWATLRVNPTDSLIRCSYAVTVGPDGAVPAPGASCNALPVNPLAGAWYYIIATCDMDQKGGTNATFCMESWNNNVLKTNYGK